MQPFHLLRRNRDIAIHIEALVQLHDSERVRALRLNQMIDAGLDTHFVDLANVQVYALVSEVSAAAAFGGAAADFA